MGNAPSSTSLVLSLGIVLAIASLAAFLYRGRREATGPRCRRCGYDVSQRPPGIERCSECGADLTQPRAIATTRRRPHWLAAMLATAGATVAAMWTVRVGRAIDWHVEYLKHAPTSWLIADAKRDHSTNGDDYRLAWRDRGERRGEYFDHLLDLQRDVAGRPDLLAIFDGMEAAFLDGVLTPAQRQRYIEGIQANVELRVSKRARIGDPVQFAYHATERIGEFDRVRRLRFMPSITLTLDGDRPSDFRPDGYVSSQANGIFGGSGDASLWPSGTDPPPGPHRFTLRVGYAICSCAAGEDIRNATADMKPVWTPIEVARTFNVDVLPRGATLGRPIVDPAAGQAIAAAVGIDITHPSGNELPSIDVVLFPARIDRAFAVKVRVDGVDREIGKIVARAGDSGEMVWSDDVTNILRAIRDPVTLVLESDAEALKYAFDQQRYWSGRIEFANVPVVESRVYRQVKARPTTVPAIVTPATPPPTTAEVTR